MPFKSKAQRRKFAELLMKGEISPQTFEEWNRETGKAKLPERVTSARKRTARRKPTPTPRPAASKRRTAATSKTGSARTAASGRKASTRTPGRRDRRGSK
jgi:hypothetical protein